MVVVVLILIVVVHALVLNSTGSRKISTYQGSIRNRFPTVFYQYLLQLLVQETGEGRKEGKGSGGEKGYTIFYWKTGKKKKKKPRWYIQNAVAGSKNDDMMLVIRVVDVYATT